MNSLDRFFKIDDPVYRVPCEECKAESGKRCRTTIRIVGCHADDMPMAGVHHSRFVTLERWRGAA